MTGPTYAWGFRPDHQNFAAIASSRFEYLTNGKVCASTCTF